MGFRGRDVVEGGGAVTLSKPQVAFMKRILATRGRGIPLVTNSSDGGQSTRLYSYDFVTIHQTKKRNPVFFVFLTPRSVEAVRTVLHNEVDDACIPFLHSPRGEGEGAASSPDEKWKVSAVELDMKKMRASRNRRKL